MKNNLPNLLKDIETYSRTGNRKALNTVLRTLMNERHAYYQQSIREALQPEFSEALYKALLLELDEEEEDSIETAELAYVSLGTALNGKQSSEPEYYKRRLLLLHYFCDFFTDSIIELFLTKYKEDNRLQARNLAIECLEKMQLADMLYLEENNPDFIEKDEQIADACNRIAISPDLSAEERKEALLLHKILYAYLKTKYKN
ncbi:hypothetical protein [Odoribacter sp. Z80]|uniref:hypothetical protein n=1 Tax=Odoribacter sp. Z80 TaxID=2304575 RepID=UPI00137A9154|nr:hypothetical protein [Odoribacter sp. Z80]NCE71767.1 hypothetical protein [Odoribacter sp. Z80]